jgi:serine/threonine protein phosphatase 1
MNKMRRIAAIGDIHGCLDELEQLLKRLEWISLDGIYHLGDLVDRGPDSGGVLALCRERKMEGVLGNHEESILKHWDRIQAGGESAMNDDKRRTLSQMTAEDTEYIRALPTVKVVEDLNAVLVHGGLWPSLEIARQPKNVIRCQMIKQGKPGDTRWWGKDASSHKSGRTEDQNKEDGYVRWYELWDQKYDVYYGHSVWAQPFIQKKENFGRTIGIDTGSCFGGALTASIIGDDEPWFVTVKSQKVHFEKSYRVHQE